MLKMKMEQYFGHLMQRANSLEKPWCWERLKAGGEGGGRGWDGWKASPIQRTWVWANCRRWWRTGKHGVLQFMGLKRVGQDWGTEQKWQHRFFSTRNPRGRAKITKISSRFFTQWKRTHFRMVIDWLLMLTFHFYKSQCFLTVFLCLICHC